MLLFVVASACGNGGSEDASKQAEGVDASPTPALGERPVVPIAGNADREQELLQEIEHFREEVARLESERDSYQQRIRELEAEKGAFANSDQILEEKRRDEIRRRIQDLTLEANGIRNEISRSAGYLTSAAVNGQIDAAHLESVQAQLDRDDRRATAIEEQIFALEQQLFALQ